MELIARFFYAGPGLFACIMTSHTTVMIVVALAVATGVFVTATPVPWQSFESLSDDLTRPSEALAAYHRAIAVHDDNDEASAVAGYTAQAAKILSRLGRAREAAGPARGSEPARRREGRRLGRRVPRPTEPSKSVR